MGIVEVLIRKFDGTEAEADALKQKLSLLTLSSEWDIRVKYIEHREVVK